MRVQTLLFETKALNLVEVLGGLRRHNRIRGNPDHGLFRWVLGGVKCQRRLSRNECELEKKKYNCAYSGIQPTTA